MLIIMLQVTCFVLASAIIIIIMYPCISLQKILPSLSKIVEKSMKAELHMDSLVALYGKINPYGGHLITSKLVCVILSPQKSFAAALAWLHCIDIYTHSLHMYKN